MWQLWMIDRRCFYYVFIVVVISYETTAAAGWTLMFIVRAFINHTITVAIWTSFSFHLCLRRSRNFRPAGPYKHSMMELSQTYRPLQAQNV